MKKATRRIKRVAGRLIKQVAFKKSNGTTGAMFSGFAASEEEAAQWLSQDKGQVKK